MAVKLVFLGTGSGRPMPNRNVSSMGLVREGDLYLFDCGEGTQIQLARSSLRPGSIQAIFLSHFHGDHVNGLPGLLGSLTLNQRSEPLTVVGPKGLREWFGCLRKLRIMGPGFPIHLHEISEAGVVYERPGFRIQCAPLRHRIKTWGYVAIEDERPGRFDLAEAEKLGVPRGPAYGQLQRGQVVTLADGREVQPEQVLGPSRPGLRIAYCCDTAPCPRIMDLAAGADVLVHESTYLGGEEKMAHERGHSTCLDAAYAAREADVSQLILTHFSQKIPGTKPFVDQARKVFENVQAAHDLMEFEVQRREA